jgi:hypothetical protein
MVTSRMPVFRICQRKVNLNWLHEEHDLLNQRLFSLGSFTYGAGEIMKGFKRIMRRLVGGFFLPFTTKL